MKIELLGAGSNVSKSIFGDLLFRRARIGIGIHDRDSSYSRGRRVVDNSPFTIVVEHDERTCMSLESQSEELHLHSSEQSGAY